MEPTERILFVDDDQATRQAFVRSMSRKGFEIDAARDAWAAMKFAKRHAYAVVVTDFLMPGLNGLEVVEELRHLQPHATFVLLSGCVDLEALAAHGANERLTGRPVVIDEENALGVLHGLLQLRQAAAGRGLARPHGTRGRPKK